MLAHALLINLAVGPACLAQTASSQPAPTRRVADEGPGDWLLHLARHHGHVVGRAAEPRSTTLHVLALMTAAGKVQPDLAEAWLWQYDLLGRINRPAEALDALKHYIQLEPTDESAQLLFVDQSIARLQTAEARVAFIRDQLKRPNLPRSVASDLNVRLADYHRQRGETEQAGKCIENALRLMPSNVAARRMSYELFGETEPALQRVELALAMIAANPGQVNLLWELGEMLDSLSLHREAQEWYVRAIDLHERGSKTPVPPDYWFQLAQSYSNAGDFKQALEAADKALKADPNFGRAKILRSYLAGKLKQPDPDAALNELARKYDGEADQVLAQRNIAKAAELAWFYAYHRPDPERALKLAQLATSVPDNSTLAQRALGFALLLNNKPADALAKLQPLADVDQMAAVGAARALIATQKEGEAVALLHKAAGLSYSGIGFEEISKMLEKTGEKPPTRPAHERIVDALHRFDRRIFDFHKRPGDFLKLNISLLEQPLPPVGPWRAVIRLENVGPFPITVGEGMMAQPLALLSARLGDEQGGRYDNYAQVLLNRRPVMPPGDAIEIVTDLDIGPLREQLIQNASWSPSVEIDAIFDPVLTEKGFESGLSTVKSPPLTSTRAGLPRDLPGVKRLVLALKDGPLKERVRAIDGLGALLAENDRMSAAPTDDGVKVDAIRKRLVSLLDDPNWLIRAHVLEAMRWSKQPADIIEKCAKCIHDPNYVVQMMAIRFFFAQQGEKFRKVLESLANDAPEPAVRILARSYLPPAPETSSR